MSKLLINEEPLQVLPTLAKKVGLNEAIILQQIHYWNRINEKNNHNFYDGYYWTYNTYEDWQKQFPFWSTRTIQRAINRLEKLKLVVSGNYNELKLDKTKWYRINYKVLDILEEYPSRHNGTIEMTKWLDYLDSLTKPIPETNNTENNNKDNRDIRQNVNNSQLNNSREDNSSLNSIEKEALEVFELMPRKDINKKDFIPIYKKMRLKYSREYLELIIDRYIKIKELKGEFVYHKPDNFFKFGEYKHYLDENWESTLAKVKKKARNSSKGNCRKQSPSSSEPKVSDEWANEIDNVFR